MAGFYDIDYAALMAEKDALYKDLRRQAEAREEANESG
jgi:hypothetical protein